MAFTPTHGQQVAVWRATNAPLIVVSFDNTNFFLAQGTVDEFVLRPDTMLSRSDVEMSITSSTVAEIQAALVNLNFEGETGDGGGLGFKKKPTNFTVPNGYAQLSYPDGTVYYKKVQDAPKDGAGNQGGGGTGDEKKETFFQKNRKYIIGIGVAVVLGVVAFLGFRKPKRKN